MNKAGKTFAKTAIAGSLLSGLVACSNPTDQEYVDQAVLLLESGDTAAATIELKNAVRGNPQNVQARLLLGQTYLDLGQMPEAEKEFRRALELGADKSLTLPMLASALYQQFKFDDIIGEFSFFDEGLDPSAVATIQGFLGRAYILKGDYQKADFAFQSALELAPDSRQALLGQSSLLALQGNLEQALELTASVLEQYPTFVDAWTYLGIIEQMNNNGPAALAAYDKAAELSNYPRVDNNARRAYLKVSMGDYDGALEDIELLRENGYGDYPFVNFVAGAAYFRQAKYIEAEEPLKKAVDGSPDNTEAKILLFTTYMELGNVGQARQLSQRLFATIPNKPLSSRLISSVYAKEKNFEKAGDILKSSLKDNPDNLSTLRMLGIIALMEGDAKGGVSYFDQVLALDPDASGVMELRLLAKVAAGESVADQLSGSSIQSAEGFRVYLLHAINLLQEGDVEEAMKIGDKLANAQPDNPQALNLVAGCYVAQQDWERAKEYLEKTLAVDPVNASATHTLAQIELLYGDKSVAESLLSTYLASNNGKGQPRTYLLLSDVKSLDGDSAGAKKTLMSGLETFPQDASLTLALARHYLRAGDVAATSTLLEDISDEQGREQPALWELKGKAAILSGDPAAARFAFQEWLELVPEDTRALNFYADSLLRNNQAKESLPYFARSIDGNPNYLEPRIGELNALMAVGDLENAGIAMAAIEERFKETTDIQWVDGRLATLQGDYARAIVQLSLADEELEAPLLTLDLARAQWLGGDKEQATETLEKWIEKYPTDVTVRLELAGLYLNQGDLDKAALYYKDILEIAPRQALALNNLASIYARTEPQVALAYAEKAYVEVPNNPHVQDTLGMLLVEQGQDTERGLGLLQQAVASHPGNAEFRLHLAQALLRQGQVEEARKALEQLLEMDLDAATAEQARALQQEML